MLNGYECEAWCNLPQDRTYRLHHPINLHLDFYNDRWTGEDDDDSTDERIRWRHEEDDDGYKLGEYEMMGGDYVVSNV